MQDAKVGSSGRPTHGVHYIGRRKEIETCLMSDAVGTDWTMIDNVSRISERTGLRFPAIQTALRAQALSMDGAVHAQIRADMAQDGAQLLAPPDSLVATVLDEVLEDLPGRDPVDVVEHVSNACVAHFFGKCFGVSRPDFERLRSLQTSFGQLEQHVPSLKKLQDMEVLARCALEPLGWKDGSAPEGRNISERRLTVLLSLGIGMEPLAAHLSEIVFRLGIDPHLQARVRKDPGLATALVHEITRVATPLQKTWRKVTADRFEMRPHIYEKGTRFELRLAMANLEDEDLRDAGTFDVDRQRAPSLSFGKGAHKCVGMAATYKISTAFVRTLLRSFDVRVTTATPARETISTLHRISFMPAVFHPLTVRGAAE